LQVADFAICGLIFVALKLLQILLNKYAAEFLVARNESTKKRLNFKRGVSSFVFMVKNLRICD
jgi:hypothetical protein